MLIILTLLKNVGKRYEEKIMNKIVFFQTFFNLYMTFILKLFVFNKNTRDLSVNVT